MTGSSSRDFAGCIDVVKFLLLLPNRTMQAQLAHDASGNLITHGARLLETMHALSSHPQNASMLNLFPAAEYWSQLMSTQRDTDG